MLNPRLDDLIRYPLERSVAARDGIAAAALVPDTPENDREESARRGWRQAGVPAE